MYVRAWVRGCAPHHANISKIVQDATRAGATGSRSDGTQAPERPPQEQHHRTQAQERERDQRERTSKHTSTRV